MRGAGGRAAAYRHHPAHHARGRGGDLARVARGRRSAAAAHGRPQPGRVHRPGVRRGTRLHAGAQAGALPRRVHAGGGAGWCRCHGRGARPAGRAGADVVHRGGTPRDPQRGKFQRPHADRHRRSRRGGRPRHRACAPGRRQARRAAAGERTLPLPADAAGGRSPEADDRCAGNGGTRGRGSEQRRRRGAAGSGCHW